MRLEKLDIFRGVAIFLMVIFHLNYSLINIFNIELLNFSETFWFIIGKISVLLFIFISGISFFLAEQKYGQNIYKKYFKISSILFIIAGLISLSTYLFIPEQYIRFGIIHFFALSFLLLLLFSSFKYYNILFGFFFIIYGVFFIPVINFEYLYFLGFIYDGFNSADFYPIFPYFGFMLLGYSIGLILNHFKLFNLLKLKSNKNFIYLILEYFGKNSLIIYLIHQPIIISIIWLLLYLR